MRESKRWTDGLIRAGSPQPALADRIRALRAHHGWSRQQLADEVGVSCRTIEGYEAGRTPSPPARKILEDLMEGLN